MSKPTVFVIVTTAGLLTLGAVVSGKEVEFVCYWKLFQA